MGVQSDRKKWSHLLPGRVHAMAGHIGQCGCIYCKCYSSLSLLVSCKCQSLGREGDYPLLSLWCSGCCSECHSGLFDLLGQITYMLAITGIGRNPKGQPLGLLTEMSNKADLYQGQDMTEQSWDVMLTLSVNPGVEDLLKQYSGELDTIYHNVLQSDLWRLQFVYKHSRVLHMVWQAPHEVG